MGMTFEQFDRALEGMEYDLPPFTYAELCNYSDELQETYAKPVYMTKEQIIYFKNAKIGLTFFGFYSALQPDVELGIERNTLFDNINQDDLIRAWDNPKEVIKVVE